MFIIGLFLGFMLGRFGGHILKLWKFFASEVESEIDKVVKK